MMNEAALIDELVTKARGLSVGARMRLIERVASSVEQEVVQPQEEAVEGEHWGQSLGRLLDSLPPVEFVHPEIEDAVEWVKQLRRDQARERGLDWGTEE